MIILVQKYVYFRFSVISCCRLILQPVYDPHGRVCVDLRLGGAYRRSPHPMVIALYSPWHSLLDGLGGKMTTDLMSRGISGTHDTCICRSWVPLFTTKSMVVA
jgi:hypothetical protein